MECLCPPPTPHSPLKPYTLFIFQSSRSCSPTPLNFSLSSPFLQPALAQCHLSPPPTPQWSVREGFTWKWHIWLATSVCVTQHLTPLCRFSGGAQLPFSSFFFLFFYSDSAPPPLQHHTLLHSCPKWEKKRQRGRQTDRWRDWEGGFRKERHGQWTLV